MTANNDVAVFRKDDSTFDAIRISRDSMMWAGQIMNFCGKQSGIEFLPTSQYPKLMLLHVSGQSKPEVLRDGDWLMRDRGAGRVASIPCSVVGSSFQIVDELDGKPDGETIRDCRSLYLEGMPEEVRRWFYQNMSGFAMVGFDRAGVAVDFMMAPNPMVRMALFRSMQVTLATQSLENPAARREEEEGGSSV